MESFLTSLGPSKALAPLEIFFSLCMSFVLGMTIATVYRYTHQGFTYARSFLQTMVLATIVITIMIVAQAVLNLGAVLSLLPVMGVTLPFLSFGGSSLVVTLAGVGVLLNVARQGR